MKQLETWLALNFDLPNHTSFRIHSQSFQQRRATSKRLMTSRNTKETLAKDGYKKKMSLPVYHRPLRVVLLLEPYTRLFSHFKKFDF